MEFYNITFNDRIVLCNLLFAFSSQNLSGKLAPYRNDSLCSECSSKITLVHGFFGSYIQILDFNPLLFCFIFTNDNNERNVAIERISNLILKLGIILLVVLSTDICVLRRKQHRKRIDRRGEKMKLKKKMPSLENRREAANIIILSSYK